MDAKIHTRSTLARAATTTPRTYAGNIPDEDGELSVETYTSYIYIYVCSGRIQTFKRFWKRLVQLNCSEAVQQFWNRLLFKIKEVLKSGFSSDISYSVLKVMYPRLMGSLFRF